MIVDGSNVQNRMNSRNKYFAPVLAKHVIDFLGQPGDSKFVLLNGQKFLGIASQYDHRIKKKDTPLMVRFFATVFGIIYLKEFYIKKIQMSIFIQ